MRTVNKITINLKWVLVAITPFIMATAPLPVPLPAPTGSHSLAICTSGGVIGFGSNSACQLGTGSSSYNEDPPIPTSSIGNIVMVSEGASHSLALQDDGTVWVWGDNSQGQAAQSNLAVDVCTPEAVSSLGCAVAVSAGGAFSMALLADGTVWTWGDNLNGQLGNGNAPTDSHTPVQVTGITTATAISAGSAHAMALLEDGTVKVWGYGSDGQMGNNSTTTTNPSAVTASISGIVKIEAGGNHCLALQNTGKLYVWGDNLKGQLGLGFHPTDQLTPVSSAISSGTIIDMAAGIDHTLILKSNGTMRVCGHNAKLQLGISSGTIYNSGQNGPTISGIVDIATSSSHDHNLAVTSSGALYTWGNNDRGQLGVGSGSGSEYIPQHVNYSGSGVCSVKPSVDIQPQPCCVAVEDDDRTVIGTNGGTVTFTTSQTYTGLEMAIFGTVVLNGGTHYFNGCDVVMGKDAKIIVKSGVRLYIRTNSHLYACGDMWDGIYVEDNGLVFVQSGSLIEDAEVALDIDKNGKYYAVDATFNRNYIHIRHIGPTSSGNNPYRVVRSKFLCQTTASIDPYNPVHTNLLPPRQNEFTWTQITATNVGKLRLGSSGNGNIFDHAVFGIIASGVTDVEVLYNDFNDVGWFSTYVTNAPNVSGAQIDINYNTYDKSIYPIYCYDNDTTVRTKITYNTIDFAGMSATPYEKVGITVEEITPATEHNTANFLDVSHNNILNAPMGIELMNLQGDLFTTDAALYIGDNYITHSKDASYATGSGIKTNYVTQGAFIRDTVTHPSGHVNWWETGMRFSHGSANAIICNTTHDVGRGMFFDGWQSDTEFINNTMDNNQTGLFLNWAVIGQQGSAGNPWDNRWLGTSWSGSDPNTHVEGTDGTLSPFYVRPSTPYNPQYNTDGSSGIPLTINTTSGSWGNGCGTITGASFKTDGTQSNGNENLLSILELPEPETDRERSLQYMGRYSLYRKLLTDAEVASSEPELQSFFEEHNAGNMGVLHRAVVDFRAARNGSEMEPSLTALQNVQPENRVEQTLTDVFTVLYAHASDLAAMDAESENRLRDIAQLCPLDHGFGVYTARAALLKLDTLPKHYTSECERVPSPEQMSEKRGVEENQESFLVYPNPNHGAFTLNYSLDEFEDGAVKVYDLIGKQVLGQKLNSDAGTVEIVLSELNSGIYILKVDVDGENRFSERISILK